jgi:hypothetical protein
MKDYITFYADQVYDERDSWRAADCPDGMYIYSRWTTNWYLVRWGSSTPINQCDVPATLRTMLLLMDTRTTP